MNLIDLFQIQKPDIFSIPRGNLDLEPDVELTEEEKRLKEKRMHDLKKMIAIQSLQNLNVDESVATSAANAAASNNQYITVANTQRQVNGNNNNNNATSYHYAEKDFNFEKEKKAREQVKIFTFYLK